MTLACRYGDLYNFVPLRSNMSEAKVCTDTGDFCCLAELEAEFTPDTVFSLGGICILFSPNITCMFAAGVFRGDHYKDGSVAGHWRMEMCTVIKCDPGQPDTCRQVPTRDT